MPKNALKDVTLAKVKKKQNVKLGNFSSGLGPDLMISPQKVGTLKEPREKPPMNVQVKINFYKN